MNVNWRKTTVMLKAMPHATILTAPSLVNVRKDLGELEVSVKVTNLLLTTALVHYSKIVICCVDVNECAEVIDTCGDPMRADCSNTYGSFLCTCKVGYTGDGINCTG